MGLYKDIISYELADNITEEHLLSIAQQIVGNWMSKQAGFKHWEIHKTAEGKYVDIVYWESQKAAQLAELAMSKIPNAMEWFACYKEGSISSKKLHKLAQF